MRGDKNKTNPPGLPRRLLRFQPTEGREKQIKSAALAAAIA
jgi:hypothetical protein